jgi:hypothetical protein
MSSLDRWERGVQEHCDIAVTRFERRFEDRRRKVFHEVALAEDP